MVGGRKGAFFNIFEQFSILQYFSVFPAFLVFFSHFQYTSALACLGKMRTRLRCQQEEGRENASPLRRSHLSSCFFSILKQIFFFYFQIDFCRLRISYPQLMCGILNGKTSSNLSIVFKDHLYLCSLRFYNNDIRIQGSFLVHFRENSFSHAFAKVCQNQQELT